MFKFSRKSILIKLVFTILFVIFVQMLLLVGSFLLSGISSTLRASSFDKLRKIVEVRGNYLSDKMRFDFGNITNYTHDIIELHEDSAQPNGYLAEEDVDSFFIELTSIFIEMLNSSFTTGVFAIFDKNGDGDLFSTLYLYDQNPFSIDRTNQDIFILDGSAEIAPRFEPPLQFHSMWPCDILLDENLLHAFERSIEGNAKEGRGEELGYWLVSDSIIGDNSSELTFTLPIIGKNGKVLGIFGTQIAEKSFYDVLIGSDVKKDDSLDFFLAREDKSSGSIIPVMIHHETQEDIIALNLPLDLKQQGEYKDVYEIMGTDLPVFCSVTYLNLYGSASLVDDNPWLLIGMSSEENLFKALTCFFNQMGFAFLISTAISLFLAFFMGKRFTAPISKLTKEIDIDDSSRIVSLCRTGYSEIDKLASSIELFNQRLFDGMVRTDKIIDLVNLPLGIFEYEKGSGAVRCSAPLLSLLDLPKDGSSHSSIESQLFFQRINEIKVNVEDEQNSIYQSSCNPAKWIKIVSIEHEKSILGIGMDVTKEIIDSNIIKFERDHDVLTKLFNRLAFRRIVEKIFEQGVEKVAACVLFDLDNLKYVNDTYGHEMGDSYIKTAAEVLSDKLQEKCVVGRIAGDEFYIFLYGFESKECIRDILRTVYDSFNYNYMILPNGKPFKIRMSGGIAWYEDDSFSLDELIRFADFAMYQGKHSVKGEIMEFDRNVYKNESFLVNGSEELNRILDNQSVDYAFQPIISAKTGDIYAYESLMRPNSKVLNTPIKLIQIATTQSQLWQIERITFFKTLSLYMKYNLLFNDCKIFINSVPNESLTDAEYLQLEELYPAVLKNVVIEIIENEKLDTTTLERKRALTNRWGGLIALDDYGSGYNGDISLLSLMPQIVKIDRLMIVDIEVDKNRQSIVQKLLLYAKEQGIMVLAEGVETYSQMEYLVQMGVDFLQGFYIARPGFIPNFNNETIAKEILEIHQRGLGEKE